MTVKDGEGRTDFLVRKVPFCIKLSRFQETRKKRGIWVAKGIEAGNGGREGTEAGEILGVLRTERPSAVGES